MEKATLIKELKEIVTPYAQEKDALNSINEDTDFINDLKINSAHLVDVVLDVEEKYDIEIENEAMEQMLNVKAAITIIENKLANK